ncbi:MAG: class I SAM-dependent methyltransferase [Pseudomonadota bacterium]|nr:class I SAM-dependent methyltransferase [Pseudomonadota bacterium]
MTLRDTSIFDESPWLAGGPDRLGPARAVPTMLAHEEELLLYWLTAAWATGAGAIVDLGCFAGGSTARLAQGQAQAGHSAPIHAAPIHAYDRFGADEAAKSRLLYPAGVAPFAGEDLLPTATALLAPWSERITLHKEDLIDTTWPGDPIEVLVIDASKSTATLDAIARTFYPALRPGSIVVQCGALHWREPWVMAQMLLMSDCFTPLAHAHDTSFVFHVTRTPDARAIDEGRTTGLKDKALAAILKSSRALFEDYGTTDQLDSMLAAIAASPGIREAWKMTRP